MFSQDRMWEGIEKCLITARDMGEHDDKIIPLLFECVLEPNFLMFSQNTLHIGDIAEVLEQFGWELAEQIVCNLGVKVAGRSHGTLQGSTRDSIKYLQDLQSKLDQILIEPEGPSVDYDEEQLVSALVSGDMQQTFDAVTQAIDSGAHIKQVLDTMVMLAGDRMARTPASFDLGWFNISHEMQMAASARKVLKYETYRSAVQATYFAAWHSYENRWLNVQAQPLSTPDEGALSKHADESTAREEIIELIESIRVPEVTAAVRAYIRPDYDTDALLKDVTVSLVKHDTGENLLGTLRTVYDERKHCGLHPARERLLIGICRFTTDVRRRDNNELATHTAKRFARRETSVDQF